VNGDVVFLSLGVGNPATVNAGSGSYYILKNYKKAKSSLILSIRLSELQQIRENTAKTHTTYDGSNLNRYMH